MSVQIFIPYPNQILYTNRQEIYRQIYLIDYSYLSHCDIAY